jgi:hypothetical protein
MARWALPVFGTLTVLVIAATGPASALAHQDLLASAGTGLALGVPFAGVGVAVARRQPRNPIGWLSLVFAFCFLLSNDAGFYLVGRYRLGRPLPLAPVMLFFQPLWKIALLILPLVVLLFPDGRLAVAALASGAVALRCPGRGVPQCFLRPGDRRDRRARYPHRRRR